MERFSNPNQTQSITCETQPGKNGQATSQTVDVDVDLVNFMTARGSTNQTQVWNPT